MNKQLIISLIVGGVLVIGGVGAYLASRGDDNDAARQAEQNGIQRAEGEEGDQPLFNALATANQSFVATLSGESDGQAVDGTIEFDGRGSSKFSGMQEGQNYEMYMTPDRYIVCQDGECFEVPAGQSGVPIDESQYSYDDEDFEDIANRAIYEGRQSCPAGTCNVWRVSDDDYVTRIYISDDQRISQVVGEGQGSNVTVVYSYQPVTITLPSNIQAIPTPEL